VFAKLCEDWLEVFITSSSVYVELYTPPKQRRRSMVVLRVSGELARAALSAKHHLPQGVTLDWKRGVADVNRRWVSRRQTPIIPESVTPLSEAPVLCKRVIPPPPPPVQRKMTSGLNKSVEEEKEGVGSPSVKSTVVESVEDNMVEIATHVAGEYLDWEGKLFYLVDFLGYEGKGEYFGYYPCLPEHVSLDLVEDFLQRKQSEQLIPYTHEQWAASRRKKRRSRRKKKVGTPPPAAAVLEQGRVAGSPKDKEMVTNDVLSEVGVPFEGADEGGGIAARVSGRRRQQTKK